MSTLFTPPDAPVGVAVGLRAVVDELVARHGVEAGDGAVLLEALVEVTAAIGRLQAVQVMLAEKVADTDVVAATGWASVKDLLTHLNGGRKGTGGGILRLAEQTAALPQVRAAMLAGDVSPAQARTIGRRVTTLPTDPELRAHAAAVMLGQVRDEALDATDLDRAFGTVLTEVDPDGTLLGQEERFRASHERGAHQARHLSLVPDEVGGVRITGYAGIEDAELVRTTLAPLTAPVITEPGTCGGDPAVDWMEASRRRHAGLDVPSCPTPGCAHDGRDVRDHGVRLLDALVEVCRRVQGISDGPGHGPGALPRDHGTTARITVTIDHDTLTTRLDQLEGQAGTGLLGSGQRLTAAAVRRLACDAEILPAVLGAQGRLLDLGRSQRLVTTSLWLGVVLRDQHCSFPGCNRPPRACEAHHIQHWADGGTTSLDNLTLLCRAHHNLTHHSPWTISIDPECRRPVWTPPPRAPDRHLVTRILQPPATPPAQPATTLVRAS